MAEKVYRTEFTPVSFLEVPLVSRSTTALPTCALTPAPCWKRTLVFLLLEAS